MGIEMPMVSAVLSRMDDSERHLAALGGVVFPVALIVEAPIIMMLAASTALCSDLDAFRRLRRFMTRAGFLLTLVMIAIAFTPLSNFIASEIIGVPEEVVGPSQTGLQIMVLWTWMIADRRFHQGVLIRFGRGRLVGVGTLVRLCGSMIPLAIGLFNPQIPGIVVAASAFALGVLFELVYARWCARSVVRGPLAEAERGEELTPSRLWKFYVPLALTPLFGLLSQPIGAAGIARMPMAIESLAAWPALSGFGFMLRSVGHAFNEVAVSLAGSPGGRRALNRFSLIAGIGLGLVNILFAATPLADWWFGTLTGLDPELTELCKRAVWWILPMSATCFLFNCWQGILVHERKTRVITVSVIAFLVVSSSALVFGAWWDGMDGAQFATIALAVGSFAQLAVLGWAVRQSRSASDAANA